MTDGTMRSASDTGPFSAGRLSADAASGVRVEEEHCIFECSGQVFAVGLGVVREVLSGKLATPIPQAPPALIGVVDWHGDVLPVVQLGTLLGTTIRPYTPASQIVVISSHGSTMGIVVDRVRSVGAIDGASLRPASHHLYCGWFMGTTPAVAVLNASALVTHAVQTIAAHLHEALSRPTHHAANGY